MNRSTPQQGELLPPFTVDDAVLREARGHFRLADWPAAFPAATIDPQRHRAVAAVSGFALHEQPLLWVDPEGRRLVVDDRVFGDLAAVDATALTEPATVGTVHDHPLQLHPREVALLLIRAGVIRTFLHVEARLALVAEDLGPSSYEARFKGSHVFFTQERNELPLDFVVRIEGGQVTVRPGTPG